MISVKDIYWAAGFIEGEGSFDRRPGASIITCAQVERDPIDRLKDLFGGTVNLRHKPSRAKWKPAFHWNLSGVRAIGLMMTIYCLMSSKRRAQILVAIENWKRRLVSPKYRVACPRGHRYDSGLGSVAQNKRRCRKCYRLNHPLVRVIGGGHHKGKVSESQGVLVF